MRAQPFWRTICLVFCALLLTACAAQSPRRLGGEVADMRHFPQDLHAYADKAGNGPLLDTASQAAQWERYKRLYFGPWQASKAGISKENAFSDLKGTGYAENLLPRSAAAIAALVQNSNQAAYPSRLDRGITVRATALRAAPTALPRFNNPQEAGEGYPFDMWQYATLPPGMPVLMTHTSADGGWIFIENALAAGWVAEQDLAEVDSAFMEHYRSAPLMAVIQEGTTFSAAGRIIARADIGTLLPQTGNNQVLIPVRDVTGKARIVSAYTPAGTTAPAPLPFTAMALADLGNQLLGQTYGWGGLYGHRDCSAMLRDIFTPFGIWLPRNSSAQAQAWTFASLQSIPSGNREEYILQHARPFATLLWLPGHITLYLGNYEGNAAMFHDIWGIRTEVGGREGRYILGRALVSGVRPGLELPDAQQGADLLTRMRGMAILHNAGEEALKP